MKTTDGGNIIYGVRVLKPIDMTALLTRMADHLEALYRGGGLDATGRELLKDVNAALERA